MLDLHHLSYTYSNALITDILFTDGLFTFPAQPWLTSRQGTGQLRAQLWRPASRVCRQDRPGSGAFTMWIILKRFCWNKTQYFRLRLVWLWFWCSECSRIALWLLSECSLSADLFLTDCLKIWARMMKIDCSRQTCHRRTDRVTPWAPVGAKKANIEVVY